MLFYIPETRGKLQYNEFPILRHTFLYIEYFIYEMYNSNRCQKQKYDKQVIDRWRNEECVWERGEERDREREREKDICSARQRKRKTGSEKLYVIFNSEMIRMI